MLNVVLILVAYYVMKPVRDVLIFGQQGGPAIKSHAAAAQALLLAMMVPIDGASAAWSPRRRPKTN